MCMRVRCVYSPPCTHRASRAFSNRDLRTSVYRATRESTPTPAYCKPVRDISTTTELQDWLFTPHVAYNGESGRFFYFILIYANRKHDLTRSEAIECYNVIGLLGFFLSSGKGPPVCHGRRVFVQRLAAICVEHNILMRIIMKIRIWWWWRASDARLEQVSTASSEIGRRCDFFFVPTNLSIALTCRRSKIVTA